MSKSSPNKKGNKKHGRFKLKCASYSSRRRYEKNKKRKLLRHLKHHANDRQAVHAAANINI